MSNYKFETLQLHVDRKADPVTDARAYRSMQPLLMYSPLIPSMQADRFDCVMRKHLWSSDKFHRMYLNRELQH